MYLPSAGADSLPDNENEKQLFGVNGVVIAQLAARRYKKLYAEHIYDIWISQRRTIEN